MVEHRGEPEMTLRSSMSAGRSPAGKAVVVERMHKVPLQATVA
jgi:hypothetical protein